MNWVLICLLGVIVFSLIGMFATFLLALTGDQEKVRSMPSVQRMKNQTKVIGKVSRSMKNFWGQENKQYEKLAEMVEELKIDDKEQE